jgi:hypothetical protein
MDRIYIPTLGRVDKQIFYNFIPDKWKKMVTLVVQKDERGLYELDCDYFVTENNIGLAKTEELICRHAGKIRYIISDDDISLYRRNSKYYWRHGGTSNMPGCKRKFINEDWDNMIEDFNKSHNDGIVMCGSRHESLPPRTTYGGHFESGPCFGIYSVDGNIFSNIIDDVDFTFAPLASDLNLTMEVLTRGYRIRLFDKYLYDQGVRFATGGKGTYDERIKIEDNDMRKLQKKYPKYIISQNKRDKNGRLKYTRKWSKAYHDSIMTENNE